MSVDGVASRLNPAVEAILRSPFHWILSFGLMLISITGRRTGRRYTIPVGYQRSGDLVTVLVSEARTKQWWRNFHEPAQVELSIKGEQLRGTAIVIPPGSAEFRARTQETLNRLPFMAKVFGVEHTRGERLTDAQISALGRNIAVVQVRIDDHGRWR